MKINHTVKILSDPLNSGLLKEEEKAAEDFEQIADLEYQLDFGIDWLQCISYCVILGLVFCAICVHYNVVSKENNRLEIA